MNLQFCEKVMKLNRFFYENIRATDKMKTDENERF